MYFELDRELCSTLSDDRFIINCHPYYEWQHFAISFRFRSMQQLQFIYAIEDLTAFYYSLDV